MGVRPFTFSNADVYLGVLVPASLGPAFGCPAGDPIVLFVAAFTRFVVTCLVLALDLRAALAGEEGPQ